MSIEQTQWDRLLLNIYDGWLNHPYQKRYFQSQIEFVIGMTNNLKIVHTGRVIVVVTMLLDCSSSLFIISVQVFCQNGDS